jgi:hypothetical protein
MGGSHLLDHAIAHDGDAVCHGQRLELVVGDDHGCLGEVGQNLLDLAAHGMAEFHIEARQGLVKEEAIGIAHNGAGDRNALLFTFRNLSRHAVQNLGEMQDFGYPVDAPV